MTLFKLLKLRNVDIVTNNYKVAKDHFKGQNILKKKKIIKFIKKNHKRYKLIIIDPPYYPNKDAQQLIFSKKFKNIFNIKSKLFKVLWLTDEVNPSPKYCDLLVNDYPFANRFKNYYKKFNKDIILILGIYAFLFSQEILDNKFKDQVKKNILIAFGGNDPKNLVLKYFKFFKTLDIKKVFIVNPKTYKILSSYKKQNNLFIQKKKPMSKFLKVLAGSFSYISTPSNIMFEAWALGISGNAIPIQKRQEEMGKAFAKLKIINLLDNYKNLSIDRLKNNLKIKFKGKKKLIFKKKFALSAQKKIKRFYLGIK